MASHVWSVLCRSSIIDADTNNISLISVVEQLGFAQPANAPSPEPEIIEIELALITLWERSSPNESEEMESRTVIKAPDGQTLSVTPNKISLKKHVRARARNIFRNLKFAGIGRYSFIVQRKTDSGRWVQVANVPLDIYKTEVANPKKH